jgi:HEPN domain-containing protein
MKEDIVLRGIGKADNDLKAVKYLMAMEDAPLDVLSFHCQQAVEKYLKAYLTWAGVRVTKTHDLSSIHNLCIENDTEFKKLNTDKISQLTIYAVEIRYPEEYIETNPEEVKQFYELAKEVRELVIKRLNEKGMKDIK